MQFDRKPSPSNSQSSSPSNPSQSQPRQTAMHIDLSTIPPLIQPSPPSNTLLITQLSNPAIFLPSTLSELATLLSHHANNAPLHSFSPLKSMRRIIISFYSAAPAIALRAVLDGEEILGCRVRVYFGIDTPIDNNRDKHLAAPDAGKLFFISPPPSPPLGWTMRNEDPPNKAVHADDLAVALARLREGGQPAWGGGGGGFGEEGNVAAADMMDEEGDVSSAEAAARRASLIGANAAAANATVVYHPADHGGSVGLPAVMVEDVSAEDGDGSLDVGGAKRLLTHTARPPVELMLDDNDRGYGHGQDHDMDMS